MEQVTIEKIFVSDVTTKFGQKQKYDVYVTVNNQPFKFQAWKGVWNGQWTVGTPIELPSLNDAQRWNQNEYQGKTSYTLKAPPEASQGYGDANTQQPQQAPQQAPVQGLDPSSTFNNRVTEIEQRVIQLETEMSDFKFQKMEREIAKEKDEIPVIKEDEVNLDEINF